MARPTRRPLQINIVIGILLAYFSNYHIAQLGLGANDWRWMFGVAAVPAMLFLILLFGIPRSPRWLATQNRVEEARSILQLIGSSDPDGELKEIVDSIHLERAQKTEPLFSPRYRFPIFLAITIGMFRPSITAGRNVGAGSTGASKCSALFRSGNRATSPRRLAELGCKDSILLIRPAQNGVHKIPQVSCSEVVAFEICGDPALPIHGNRTGGSSFVGYHLSESVPVFV